MAEISVECCILESAQNDFINLIMFSFTLMERKHSNLQCKLPLAMHGENLRLTSVEPTAK